MKVIAYCRVSTEEQAVEGVSLGAQREKLRLYCQLHALDLIGIEEDAGVSAKSLERPGLKRALAALEDGRADGLVIAKLDRLSRSVSDWAALVDRYFSRDDGPQLLSVADSIDTRTAAGRMVTNILMSVAQWERETIVERTRDAMAHKRRRGERLGTIPYGTRLGADGRTLEPDAAELELLADVRRMRAAGMTLRAIAAALTARGIPTKNGGPQWCHTSVSKILRKDPHPHEQHDETAASAA